MRTITHPSTAKCTIPLYISFLLRESYTPEDLFNQAKQQLDLKGGVLSVDDSVLNKPYRH